MSGIRVNIDDVRASRLLSILLTLSVRGKVSATELANDLEVSVRTVYRDVEALGAAGVPVYATRGRGGGIHLLDGFRTRLTGLTAQEADTLFLTGLPAAAGDLGLGAVLAAGQLKLLAAMPPEQRERAGRVRDRFHLDAPGWLRDADAPPNLATIAEATWNDRRLEVRYRRSDRTVADRVLDPLGLVLKGGVWYLVARPAPDADPRTYRVSRVLAAAVREDAVHRPPSFDLGRFWVDYQADYSERIYRDTARIRLSGTGRRMLFLVGGPAVARARDAMAEPDAQGWCSTELPIESVTHAQHALLQLGEHVEVLSPPELREGMAAAAAALARLYGSGYG